MYHLISRFIPLPLKLKLYSILPYLTTYQANKSLIRNTESQVVYLLDSPTHSNLGDHAIAYAQRLFIQKHLPDATIIEIPIQLVDMHLGYIKKHIKPRDLICMIGGGNFGDEYIQHEYSKRKVATLFPNNKIIVFPQTIYYSDTPRGTQALADTQATLNSHPDLTIAARDRISYHRAREYFPSANSILVPDIVLSLDPISFDVPRNGVLCCLRKDLEKNADFSTECIVSSLTSTELPLHLSDTVAETGIPFTARMDALTNKWKEFCSSELVVTDRLHGMIFACLTSTPCIVIDNYNHKVRDFYTTWLQDVDFIYFINSSDNLLSAVQRMVTHQPQSHRCHLLFSLYQPLSDALQFQID